MEFALPSYNDIFEAFISCGEDELFDLRGNLLHGKSNAPLPELSDFAIRPNTIDSTNVFLDSNITDLTHDELLTAHLSDMSNSHDNFSCSQPNSASSHSSLDFLSFGSFDFLLSPFNVPLSAQLQLLYFDRSQDIDPSFFKDHTDILNISTEERFAAFSFNPQSYNQFTAPPRMHYTKLYSPLLDEIVSKNPLIPNRIRHTHKRPVLAPLVTSFTSKHHSKSALPKQTRPPKNLSSTSNPHTLTTSPPSTSFLNSPLHRHTSTPLPLSCPHCPKHFPRPQNLKTHLLTHSTTHAFSCLVCGYAFKRLPDLRRHFRSLHGGVKEFECGFGCERGFSRRDALKRHLEGRLQGPCAKLRVAQSE